MTRRAVVKHLKFEIKFIIKLREKKKQGSFFGGGGKGESNLGAPSHPSLPHILPSHNSTEKKCTTVPCESVTCQ